MEKEPIISSENVGFQETNPVITNLKDSRFTVVDQHDLVTVLHYEGHSGNNERFDIVPHILTVLSMFYKQ